MFIKFNVFEREVKDAYKNGRLFIYRELEDDEKIIVSGGMWTIFMTSIPKELLGSLIKIVGTLPISGECLQYSKEEVIESDVLKKRNLYDSPDEAINEKGKMIQTSITLDDLQGEVKLFRSEDGEIYEVRKACLELISRKVIERDNGETDLDGAYEDKAFKRLIYATNKGYMIINFVDIRNITPENREIVQTIKKMDIE